VPDNEWKGEKNRGKEEGVDGRGGELTDKLEKEKQE
jgi:hypothetical protein